VGTFCFFLPPLDVVFFNHPPFFLARRLAFLTQPPPFTAFGGQGPFCCLPRNFTRFVHSPPLLPFCSFPGPFPAPPAFFSSHGFFLIGVDFRQSLRVVGTPPQSPFSQSPFTLSGFAFSYFPPPRDSPKKYPVRPGSVGICFFWVSGPLGGLLFSVFLSPFSFLSVPGPCPFA